MPILLRCIALSLLFSSAITYAGDLPARLNAFLKSTQSLQANFTQTSLQKGKQQIVQGKLHIQRPGRFRWEYQKPTNQLIVGDGSFVWIFDQDLEQVSKRKWDANLRDSPAALLAGRNDFAQRFKMQELAPKQGLEWLEALPKNKENEFQRIRFGFKGKELQALDVLDSFGQSSMIVLQNVQKNPKLDMQLFKFTPPAGVDILQE